MEIMVDPQEWLNYSLILNAIQLIFSVLVITTSWEVTKVWIMAWWCKKPISLQWGKDKRWTFELPDIPHGFKGIWRINDKKNAIQVRREAVGIAPNKVPMMLSTSEYGAAVNPVECEGNHWYSPEEAFYGIINFKGELVQVQSPTADELIRFKELDQTETKFENQEYLELNAKIESWNNKKLWVRFPQSGIVPHEFVKCQQINIDPVLSENYAQFSALDAKIQQYNPLSMLTQNPMAVIMILCGFAIAYMILSDHSMAMSAAADTIRCQQQLTAVAQQAASGVVPTYNATLITTGGVVT